MRCSTPTNVTGRPRLSGPDLYEAKIAYRRGHLACKPGDVLCVPQGFVRRFVAMGIIDPDPLNQDFVPVRVVASGGPIAFVPPDVIPDEGVGGGRRKRKKGVRVVVEEPDLDSPDGLETGVAPDEVDEAEDVDHFTGEDRDV